MLDGRTSLAPVTLVLILGFHWQKLTVPLVGGAPCWDGTVSTNVSKALFGSVAAELGRENFRRPSAGKQRNDNETDFEPDARS